MIDDCIFAEADWPKEIDELVLIHVVHPNAAFAPPDDLANWMGWYPASWTSFNGGGWVWNGMLGVVTHVRAMPPRPTDALAAMLVRTSRDSNVVPIRRVPVAEGWG